MRRYYIQMFSIIFFIYSSTVFAAGMNGQLDNFFESMGYKSNVTSAGAYKSQSGGYYTGGSIFARAPASNTQIANIQMPSFRAGCGGIDLFKGAFSHINAEGLISMLRDIASGAKGYAFNLALQTITPQIYNTMTELNAIAQRINSMNINSCEAAATALGGVWPKSDASSRMLCNAMGTSNEGNVFKDWAASRQGCGAEDRRNEVNNNSNTNEQFKEIIGDEFNLAWRALKKNPFFANDDALAEFFMSISGSIISKKVPSKDGSTRFEKIHLASLANNQELINMLVFGEKKSTKDAVTYKCDDKAMTKCLNPTTSALTIDKNSALILKVENLLRSIAEKIREGTKEESAEEKAFIEATIIPIKKILAVQTAFKGGDTEVIGVSEMSEAIAHDMVLQLLDGILDTVSQNIKNLQQVQIDDSIISEFKNDISKARRFVLERRNGAFQQMNNVLSLIERTRQIEKQLHHMFIEYNDIAS